MLYQIIHFTAHVLRIDKFNVILIRYYFLLRENG
jgi:hypothetical protein